MKHAKVLRIISFSILVLFALFGVASCGTESKYNGEAVLAITKTASPASFSKVGDVITYTYEVKAIGPHFKNFDPKISISNILITDSPLDDAVTCPANTLAVDASMQCTATYTISEQDVLNGSVTNNASVSGDFWLTRDGCNILGVSVVLHHATASAPSVTVNLDQSAPPPVPVQANPALTLVKSAEPTVFSKVNKLIKFTFTITNTGDVPIEGRPFILTDSLKITDINCPSQTLAVGESISCTAWYTVQFSDINNKLIKNCATVSGIYNDPDAGPQAVISNNSCVNVSYQAPKQNEQAPPTHVP